MQMGKTDNGYSTWDKNTKKEVKPPVLVVAFKKAGLKNRLGERVQCLFLGLSCSLLGL